MSWQATYAHRHRRIEIERPPLPYAPDPGGAPTSHTITIPGDPFRLAEFFATAREGLMQATRPVVDGMRPSEVRAAMDNIVHLRGLQ